MDKNKELEKEERTIFIVLAIIIMIAVGVLITWYFTKDENKLEEKEVNKNEQVVEKQKKKNTNNTTNKKITSDVSLKKEVTIISEDVKEEEIVVVEVTDLQPVQIPNTSKDEDVNSGSTEKLEADIKYSTAIGFYVTNEIIELTAIDELEIISIEDVKGINEIVVLTNEVDYIDVNGKFLIIENNKVMFKEKGSYVLFLNTNDGVKEVTIHVKDELEFNLTNDALLNEVANYFENQNEKYFDNTLWNDTKTNLENTKTSQSSNLVEKHKMFLKLSSNFHKLCQTKDKEAELADKKMEVKDKEKEAEEYVKDEYTIETYQVLEELILKLTEVLESEDISKMNEYINKLNEAINNLEKKQSEVIAENNSENNIVEDTNSQELTLNDNLIEENNLVIES